MVSFNALLGFILLVLVSKASSSYIHGCYLSNVTNPQQQFHDFKLDTYTSKLCSHIFFSYAQIKDDFTMDAVNPGHLKWGAENKFYNQLNKLKSQQPDLKTILSLGGSCDFKKMLIDNEQKQTFVQSATSFVKQFEFDGIDIDVSQTVINKKAFTEIIGDFEKALSGKLIIVSVPAHHESLDSTFDVPAIAKYSNFINLLAVQSDAKHSNLLFDEPLSNTFDSMFNWVSNGLPKDKLVVGLNLLENGKTRVDQQALDNLLSVSFNVQNKWMKENGFGGAFVHFMDVQKKPRLVSCCDQYPDQEIVDNDLVSTLGQLNECCDFCASLTVCNGWTWDSTNGGKCWFKTSIGPTVTKTGAFTGVFCDTRKKAEKKKVVNGIKNKSEL